jgi:hypothetical protein
VLAGRAQDVVTGRDGTGSVVAAAQLTATLDPARKLQALHADPDGDLAAVLVGSPVGSGFRRLVDAAVPQHRQAQSPLYLLLDDLPVAALISGYAELYFRPDLVGDRPSGHPRADVCSGWRADGTMMNAIRDEGRIPVPIGPVAPPLERQGDDLSWHRLEPLPTGAMRRHRRLDVYRDGHRESYSDPLIRVDAMFRDTHVDPDGLETVLHEYSIDATLDDGLCVTSIEATPRVLPWTECPWAAPSATRLCGEPVYGLRRLVRNNFHGVDTCTHLNDMLRSLADIAPLAALLTTV